MFYDLVSNNRARRQKTSVELDREERVLFAEPSQVGINFDAFDKIQVKSTGRDCGSHASLADFSELFQANPDGVFARNVKLMGYTKPTPVQRHAVPFALAGGRFDPGNHQLIRTTEQAGI